MKTPTVGVENHSNLVPPRKNRLKSAGLTNGNSTRTLKAGGGARLFCEQLFQRRDQPRAPLSQNGHYGKLVAKTLITLHIASRHHGTVSGNTRSTPHIVAILRLPGANAGASIVSAVYGRTPRSWAWCSCSFRTQHTTNESAPSPPHCIIPGSGCVGSGRASGT